MKYGDGWQAMATDEQIIAELVAVNAALDGVRDDMEREGFKRDVRIRTNRRATTAAIAAAVIGIAVGLYGIHAVADANAQRRQRTVAACLQANQQTDRSITAAVATSDNFIDYLGNAAKANPKTDLTKLQQFVDGSKAAQHAVIAKNYPKRDCSPAGLAAYYSSNATK